MSRKKAREGAMALIYSMEMTGEFTDRSLDIFFNEFEYTENEKRYIKDVYKNFIENYDEIDGLIEQNLNKWKLERLAKVDLSIIRVSVSELLCRKDIPTEVSINEAIEMAKKYSEDNSYKFINGVLGGISHSLE